MSIYTIDIHMARTPMPAAAKKRVAARFAAKKKASKAPKASSTFAKKVLAVVARKEETKYVSTQLGGASIPGTLTVPANLVACLPKVGQGPGSFQRIGQKINMAHGRVDFQIYLVPSGTNYPTQDVWVKLFLLNSKQAKSYAQVATLSANTLLDQGDGTTTDWAVVAGAGAYQFMPLSKEDFSGSVRTIKLTKNQGSPNADLNTTNGPNTFGRVGAVFSVPWTHKGTLIYDEGATPTNYPTNYAPVYAFVAMNSDQTPYQGLVDVQTRLHMWYKDI